MIRRNTTFTLLACLFVIGVAGSSVTAQEGSGLVTVIDVAKVFEKHPNFKSNMDKLKEEVKTFQQGVRNQVQTLAKKKQELPQQFKIGTPEFKAEEEKLAREEADLKIKTAQQEREYMDKEAKLYYATYQEVQSAIAKFAQENGISLVLRFDSTEIEPTNRASVSQGVNRFIVYQNRLDLTDLIITQFQEKYKVDVANAGGNLPR